jgi:bifunctional non-homologous end joining protein LigD
MQIADRERARRSGVAVFLYLFDVLHADGYDLTGLTLRQRKSVLRSSLTFGGPLRLTAHRNTDGEAAFRAACEKGWEGVIAKRADSTYQHRRSRDWLKFKCINEQEFVIGGYTDPKGSRQAFGALLIGVYDDGELRFAGKVGTGFDDRALAALGNRLRALERERSPFADAPIPRAGVHWVEPRLVGQVGFTEWTRDGQLRHPRFLGLRDDKRPRDVVRERPS